MTFVSAGHNILKPTRPLGSGRPQRESSPGPPQQESRALPTKLPRPTDPNRYFYMRFNPEDMEIDLYTGTLSISRVER